jgi:hypothetical protein
MVFSSNNKRKKRRSNDFVYDFCIQFLYFIQMSFDLLDLKVGTRYSRQDWVLCWTLYFKKKKIGYIYRCFNLPYIEVPAS